MTEDNPDIEMCTMHSHREMLLEKNSGSNHIMDFKQTLEDDFHVSNFDWKKTSTPALPRTQSFKTLNMGQALLLRKANPFLNTCEKNRHNLQNHVSHSDSAFEEFPACKIDFPSKLDFPASDCDVSQISVTSHSGIVPHTGSLDCLAGKHGSNNDSSAGHHSGYHSSGYHSSGYHSFQSFSSLCSPAEVRRSLPNICSKLPFQGLSDKQFTPKENLPSQPNNFVKSLHQCGSLQNLQNNEVPMELSSESSNHLYTNQRRNSASDVSKSRILHDEYRISGVATVESTSKCEKVAENVTAHNNLPQDNCTDVEMVSEGPSDNASALRSQNAATNLSKPEQNQNAPSDVDMISYTNDGITNNCFTAAIAIPPTQSQKHQISTEVTSLRIPPFDDASHTNSPNFPCKVTETSKSQTIDSRPHSYALPPKPCLSHPAVITPQNDRFKAFIAQHSPAVPDRLIGRRMGLERIDIMNELGLLSLSPVVTKILKMLSDSDLLRMSKVTPTWCRLINADPNALRRKKAALADIARTRDLLQKENQVDKETRRSTRNLTEAGSPFKALQHKQAPSISKQTSSNNPILKSPVTTHQRYWKAASKLKNHESLRKCPRCQQPAKHHKEMEKASCCNPQCLFIFCTNCFNPFHGSSACSATLGRRSKLSAPIGSQKSKKNLKRL